MKPKVYLETTIVSYLAALRSRDLVIAAHQQITHDWWQNRREAYNLFISEAVVIEIAGGDPDAAARRKAFVRELGVLEQTSEASTLAQELIKRIPLPKRASVDALHIALAVVNGMNYLLTWNCAHIARASHRAKIEILCREIGYEPPVICTPEELLEE